MYFNEGNNKININQEFDDAKNHTVKFSLNKKSFLIIGIVICLIVVGIFLIYNSRKTEYFLVLNGLEDVTIYQNTTYVDPGYKAYDNNNNDYTSEVEVTGEVNENVAGEYVIQYKFNEIVKERVVTVLVDNNQVTYLNLLGNQVIYLNVNEVYQEPGYIVLDSVDANLQDKVKVTGDVNTQKAGTYKITYSVVNSSNVTVTAERTVIVMDSDVSVSYSPTEYTNSDVTIKINIQANYFDYVLLPDGTRSTQRNLEYIVNKNGEYIFKIFDKSGNITEQKIIIKNIDFDKPVVSCVGTVELNEIAIKVSASDKGAGVSNYKYYVNDIVVNDSSKANYTYSGVDTNNIRVKVTDGIGNYTEKKCEIVYKDSNASNTNVIYYTAFNTEYVVPKTINSLTTFVSLVEGKISQTALSTCHDACLSVSLYHAYMLHYGNLERLNINDACNYTYDSKLKTLYMKTSQEVLYKVYDEITAGRSAVIQVKGSSGRHFVLAVGYKRKVYRKEDITENDLLIIDAWDGKLETMDKRINPDGRTLWNKPNEKWPVAIFK